MKRDYGLRLDGKPYKTSPEFRSKMKAYCESHKAQKADSGRRWYLANREAIIARSTARNKLLPAKHREYCKKYDSKNRDKKRAYQKNFYHKNRANELARVKRWASENPEAAKIRAKASLRFHQRNRGKILEAKLRKLYGLTREEYDKMCDAQGGLCAICRKPPTKRVLRGDEVCRLAVDHCHKTGQIRGLLCHACNIGIGNLRDDPEILEAAARYLRANRLRRAVA